MPIKISAIVLKMIVAMIAAAAIMIVAGFIIPVVYSFDLVPLYFMFGVAISTAVNIVKVVWLEQTALKSANMPDEQAAANYVRGQYLLRYVFTFVVLFGAAILGPVSLLWGAIFGIFTYHVAKYAMIAIVKQEDALFDANLANAANSAEVVETVALDETSQNVETAKTADTSQETPSIAENASESNGNAENPVSSTYIEWEDWDDKKDKDAKS